MALCVIWVFICPWFTAHNIVDFMTERRSRGLAMLGVLVFGSAFVSSGSHRRFLWKLIVRCLFFLSALVAMLYGWASADFTFAYWKVRAIPPAVWAQMASDMRKFGEVAAENGRPISPEKLPADLHLLGRIGALWVSNPSGGTNPEVILECNNYFRIWGLFVTTDTNTQAGIRSLCYKTITVAPDACFYLRISGK
jgi:hypothetical protein